MDDLIKRQDVLNLIPQNISDFEEGSCLLYDVERLPSAQKKGQWLYPTDVKGFCRCEHCGALWGRDLYENRFFKYCPRCGADMRGDEDR